MFLFAFSVGLDIVSFVLLIMWDEGDLCVWHYMVIFLRCFKCRSITLK